MQRLFRFLLGLAISIFFLFVIFYNIEATQIKNNFLEVDLKLALFSVLIFFFGYSCRIQRWRLMLIKDNPDLQWRKCAGPLMASVACNNILPFRAGDFLRAFAFNRVLKIHAATSLATLLVERMLDLLVIFSFFVILLFVLEINHTNFIIYGGKFITIFIITLILLVLFFPSLLKPFFIYILYFMQKIFPNLAKKILIELEKIFSALEYISKKTIMLKLLFWSVLAWAAEGFVFLLAALAMPAVTNYIASWLALCVGTLATVIPSTPGFVGTFDYFVVQAMTMYGNSLEAAAAYAFFVHFILWLPPIIVGGLYLLYFLSLKKQEYLSK